MPARDVRLAAYRIDRTEVTAGAYGRCVQAGVCRSPVQFPGDHRFDGPTQPVVGVSWDDAVSYCRWVGARLPTEAEWERAARGVDGRTFPWGRAWNPSLSSHGRFDSVGSDAFAADRSDGYRFTAPVGSFPDGASPYGLVDMAGNAWEWVLDWYGEYEPAPVSGGAATPRLFRVLRGGSWTSPGTWQRTTMRYQALPQYRSLEIGFRCAEDAR
jgi:formylglycine-generating enzyme required for sulfatase activity